MGDDLQSRLRAHVMELANSPRVPGTPDHLRALTYIVDHLQDSGFTCIQPLFGRAKNTPWNALTIPEPRKERPLVIVGAHYDSVKSSPGADDNASGVAAMLEVARAIYPRITKTSALVQFAAYDMEEDGLVGSREHCKRLKTTGRQVKAMLSLEMLGFKDPTPGSQKTPPGIMAPTTGDFLAVVSNEESAGLLDFFRGEGAHRPPLLLTTVKRGGPAEQMAGLSDHGAFWKSELPALLVTDTAFLRNPHYHKPSDTPGTLDYTFLEQSTLIVLRAVERMLGIEPQTAQEAA